MKFVAFERAKQGTGASRRLRNTGKTPGIVYGAQGQPQLIELDHNALWHALKKEAFHSTILEMELGGKTGKVLLRDVQYHPFKPQVMHVDFQRVDAITRLHMKVPVHYKGAEESEGENTGADPEAGGERGVGGDVVGGARGEDGGEYGGTDTATEGAHEVVDTDGDTGLGRWDGGDDGIGHGGGGQAESDAAASRLGAGLSSVPLGLQVSR